MNQLVSTEWLAKNLVNVKILDTSWHLPNVNRNAFEEYKSNHIINSIFFEVLSSSKIIFNPEFKKDNSRSLASKTS